MDRPSRENASILLQLRGSAGRSAILASWRKEMRPLRSAGHQNGCDFYGRTKRPNRLRRRTAQMQAPASDGCEPAIRHPDRGCASCPPSHADSRIGVDERCECIAMKSRQECDQPSRSGAIRVRRSPFASRNGAKVSIFTPSCARKWLMQKRRLQNAQRS